jgi:hypothetical protein
VTNVLYAKVLQRLGYSKVPKLADIEVRLDEAGHLEQFRASYRDRFPNKGEWEEVHDDPLIGPARAAQLVPAFLDDFPTPESFRQQHYQERLQVCELADRMYVRAEKRRLDRLREAATLRLATSMHEGVFVFRGLARPVREYDANELMGACNAILERAAADVFPAFRHAPLAAKTNQAAQFLAWERLDRVPRDRDPLGLVETRAGQPRVKTTVPPLSEALRAFKEKLDAAGTGRLQGSFIQDLFSAPPYGWSKDTTRYLFAALLAAGEIEIHTPGGVLRTPGPGAKELGASRDL